MDAGQLIDSPILVCLDSSDYSHLSDPENANSFGALLIAIREVAEFEEVKFVFSGSFLSEIAPLERKHSRRAIQRADLLVELCGQNALISYDKIIEEELGNLASRNAKKLDAFSGDGNWFPRLEGIAPSHVLCVASAIDDAIAENAKNRQQRRYLHSKASKKGAALAAGLAQLDGMDLDEVLARYPMRREDAVVLTKYVLGKASAKDADAAFLASLRDPRWMMRWFQENFDEMDAIGNWVRGPARKMTESLKEMVAQTTQLVRLEGMNAEGWRELQDSMLASIGNRLVRNSGYVGEDFRSEEVANYCPGLTACIRVTFASFWNSIPPSNRKLKDSDFVDAIHSMYVPYVHVFRADRYMGPIIEKALPNTSCRISSQLSGIPNIVMDLIATKRDRRS